MDQRGVAQQVVAQYGVDQHGRLQIEDLIGPRRLAAFHVGSVLGGYHRSCSSEWCRRPRRRLNVPSAVELDKQFSWKTNGMQIIFVATHKHIGTKPARAKVTGDKLARDYGARAGDSEEGLSVRIHGKGAFTKTFSHTANFNYPLAHFMGISSDDPAEEVVMEKNDECLKHHYLDTVIDVHC
ncbi:hypothetical protein EVAR_95838_1 [Eumeta japonica]|uniref:Uncharacterized protein n=1 Tax=Eumeta variegata TaxID=151549 RepID=A0A4C1VM26_EUMVA|nr:hypothetical protein EVAR_95838_1 [Eumeta japonica]